MDFESLTNAAVKFYSSFRYHRVVYNENECDPACEVLGRARKRIGEDEYSPFINNCEHFANECKTGKKECHQKWTPIEIFLKSTTATLGSLREVVSKVLQFVLKQLKIDEKKKYLFTIKNKLENILEETLEKINSNAKGLYEKYDAIFNPTYAVYIASFIELVLLGFDLYTAYNSNMNLKQFLEVIIKRICAAMFSFCGFPISYGLGGIVPLYFVSHAFFPFCGALIAGYIGDFLSKLIGGLLEDLAVFLWERFTGFLRESLVPCAQHLLEKLNRHKKEDKPHED